MIFMEGATAIVVSLYIVETHQLTRVGIEETLDTTDDIIVKGHCSDGNDAVDQLLSHKPDVALLNLDIPSIDGIHITKRLKAENSDISILIFTASYDVDRIVQALSAGARGCVSKKAAPHQLILAIKSVAEGALWIDPAIADGFASRFFKIHPDGSLADWSHGKSNFAQSLPVDSSQEHPLSQRELQVLGLLAEGYSNKQIATKLSISSETVKLHVRSITRKLQASNRWQAVAIAIRDKLL